MATIFVDNADTKHTVQLTSTMTSVDTIRMMREANQLTEDDPTWTIFELINDFGAERPLADWEIITDVLATWDASQNNGLVALNGFPQYMAKLSMDKNKKWQKRNFYSRDAAIYYSKDKKAPTDYVFAFKSQESIRIFEKPERDYIHFVCADNVVQLREWLLCIRSIKVIYNEL
ncbi:hypothetical protein BDF19DRAFT_387572 [Syncephalis fuscata]|nr:hypothetical protein BDF19DRAFT_387572 [Syncephalis fuscata]